MRYILDTTAFSTAMKRDNNLMTFLQNTQPGKIFTVPPVIAELEFGIRRLDTSSKKYLLLKSEKERLQSQINVLPWDAESSVNFGTIKADLEVRGEIIDDSDIAIGAIALSHQCTVLTSNLKHFSRINQLKSSHWSDLAVR
ncbi:MAG: type II toxin-antitoxin system VapC family toxin [Proteobacteria bacterium]|nr:type II toxin-antitoxin system VapC family toxin [Pseudomonadota bacterium]